MITVFLSLGTNLGNRNGNIQRMIEHLKKILQPEIVLSKLMETEPIGMSSNDNDWFYNLVLSGKFTGSAHELLKVCQNIEKLLGRNNKNSLEARTADIDILLVNNQIINEKDFIIPHPQILQRRFLLEGMKSIAPDLFHPIYNKSFFDLYINMEEPVQKQKIHYL